MKGVDSRGGHPTAEPNIGGHMLWFVGLIASFALWCWIIKKISEGVVERRLIDLGVIKQEDKDGIQKS